MGFYGCGVMGFYGCGSYVFIGSTTTAKPHNIILIIQHHFDSLLPSAIEPCTLVHGH